MWCRCSVFRSMEMCLKCRNVEHNAEIYAITYGGHSADLMFHIIISEFQCIILDSSPKKISWREKYLLGTEYIYWACLFIGLHLFILGTFIYSVCLCNAPWLSINSNTHLSTSPTNHHLLTHATQPPPILRAVHSSIGESPDWHCCSNIPPNQLSQKMTWSSWPLVCFQGNLRERLIHMPTCP